RASFEIRTYRLCRRVLMFHRFSGLNEGSQTLVRATELTYDEGPIVTYLIGATQRGYDETGGDEALPPVSFGYARAELSSKVTSLDAQSARRLPHGVDGRLYQLVDLDGEGGAPACSANRAAPSISPAIADRESSRPCAA